LWGEASTEILNGEVSMSLHTATFECLWSSVVSGIWVGEGTSRKVVNLDFNSELLVGCDILAGLWVNDDSGDHLTSARNVTHYFKKLAHALNCRIGEHTNSVTGSALVL